LPSLGHLELQTIPADLTPGLLGLKVGGCHPILPITSIVYPAYCNP
jgi:hypothetical protein